MANLKETRITDRVFTVRLDDDDMTKIVATVTATTRTNMGEMVASYHQDVTDTLNRRDLQVLLPLLQRGQQKIMEERNITDADLAEGNAAAEQQKDAQRVEQQRQQAIIDEQLQAEQKQLDRFAEEARTAVDEANRQRLDQQREHVAALERDRAEQYQQEQEIAARERQRPERVARRTELRQTAAEHAGILPEETEQREPPQDQHRPRRQRRPTR
jgi:hypothetical protein